MTQVEFIANSSASDIAGRIAQVLTQALRKADGEIAITVPGGSTPFPIFEELVGLDVDWPRVSVWPGDDRIVPEDHAASNTGKIRPIFEPAGARVVALDEDSRPPHFALSWLGMGADGHIASLFPNTDPQADDPQMVRRLTPDPLPPEAPFDRITLTLPALLETQAIMFTLGGSQEKRAVFDAAVAGEHDLPIARLLRATKDKGDIAITCFT